MGDGVTSATVPERFGLRGYQRKAVEFAHERHGTVYGFACRCGKTRTALASVAAWGIGRVVVIMPRSISQTVWRENVEKFLPGYDYLDLADGSPVKKRAERLRIALEYGNPKVVVGINFEAFWRPAMIEVLNTMIGFALIYDEAHHLRSNDGKASEAAFRFSQRAEHVLGLTGTPLADGPLNAFGVYRAIDPSLLGRSYTRFKGAYSTVVMVKLKTPRRGKRGRMITHYPETTGYKNQEELGRRLDTVTFRVENDVLDLVPATHEVRHTFMPSKWFVEYQRMSKGIALDIKNGQASTANALVRALRLQQLTGGIIVDDDGEEHRVHHAKRDALIEYLGCIMGEPVVVMYRFRADGAAIVEAAQTVYPGAPVSRICGGANDLEAWIAGDGGHVIAVQVSSGQEGIDLSKARTCVFYSQSFSLTEHIQAIARIHSGEQEAASVGYVYLTQHNSIDIAVQQALVNKGQVNAAILSHIKKRK